MHQIRLHPVTGFIQTRQIELGARIRRWRILREWLQDTDGRRVIATLDSSSALLRPTMSPTRNKRGHEDESQEAHPDW